MDNIKYECHILNDLHDIVTLVLLEKNILLQSIEHQCDSITA